MSITKEEMRDLLKDHAREIRGRPGSPTTPSGPAATPIAGAELTKLTDTFNPLSAGFSLIKDAGGKVAEGFKFVYQAASENIEMMKDLSKSGINFSGDVMGMTASIKGMRVSNEEFAEIMKKNSAGFNALGGNATRGAEAFAKLAQEFQASEFTDSLVAAGIGNKELNEILAMEMTTKKMAIRDDKESRRAAIESAAALAKEMDMMAKLTGKSREEQMAQMQKVKDDMALEAKIRQMAAEQGITDEAEIGKLRKNVTEQIAQAEMQGRGQLLKESFIYGQAVSKEAAQQQISVGNQAFQATVNQGRALMAMNFKESEEQGKAARRGLVDFQKSAEGLQIALLPGQNQFTEDTHKMMKATQAYRDSLAAIEQEAAFKGKSTAEIEKEAERRAKEAMEGRDKEGKQVNQSTEAMVKLQQRAKDVESAFYNHLILPLEKDLRPSIKMISDQFLVGTSVRPGSRDVVTFEQTVGSALKTGYERAKDAPDRSKMTPAQEAAYDVSLSRDLRQGFENYGKTTSKAIAESIAVAGQVAADAAKVTKAGAQAAVEAAQPTPTPRRRDLGSIGATNNLFEDFGQGTLMELHGKETVLTENQFKDLAKGIRSTSIAEVAQIQSDKSGTGQVFKEMMQKLGQEKVSDRGSGQVFKEMMQKIGQENANDQGSSQMIKEAMTVSDSAKSTAKKEDTVVRIDKKATLDDVVTSLNQLNIKLSQLVETNLEIGSKQIRATRSNSRNLFERA